MNKVSYSTKEVIFKTSTFGAVLVAYEGEEFWVPRTALSWRSDKEVEEFSRNQEVELEIADWKLRRLGID